VQSMIIDSFNTHLKNVLVDTGMLRFSPDNKAIFLQKNRRDGAVTDEQIPLSTRQNVGLATPEDLLAIDELTDRVATLENSGVTGELFYLHHDFSGITDAVRTVHFTADIGKPPTVGDSVIDSQQQSWRYVITGPATFGWVTVPHLSIGGDLQAVKSSNAEGKVYVESDNTCSVIGWNGVKNDVSSNASAITDHAGNTTNPHGVTKAQIGLGAYPASPADIGISTATQTALALKADKTELDLLIASLFPPIDSTTAAGLYNGDTSVRVSSPINTVNCTDLNNMFYGCSNLKIVGYIPTPNVTNMAYMFSGCSSLKTIPLLDISGVTNMAYMFSGCSSLTSVTFQCNDVRPYGNNMFRNTPIASGNGCIYVPDSLVQAYKTASGWSARASVIYGHSDRP
jgi:hypothetical protein